MCRDRASDWDFVNRTRMGVSIQRIIEQHVHNTPRKHKSKAQQCNPKP